MYIDIMNVDFTSNVNKTLLWDLIKDTEIFIKLASVSKREHIIDIFETQISDIAGSANFQTSPLTELNKQFLNNMIVTLQQQIVESVPSQPLSKETKADMQQQRASLFEERLKKKQAEFTNTRLHHRPNYHSRMRMKDLSMLLQT